MNWRIHCVDYIIALQLSSLTSFDLSSQQAKMEEIKEHCLDHPTHARYLLAWEPDTRGAFNTIASARYFVYQCNRFYVETKHYGVPSHIDCVANQHHCPGCYYFDRYQHFYTATQSMSRLEMKDGREGESLENLWIYREQWFLCEALSTMKIRNLYHHCRMFSNNEGNCRQCDLIYNRTSSLRRRQTELNVYADCFNEMSRETQ